MSGYPDGLTQGGFDAAHREYDPPPSGCEHCGQPLDIDCEACYGGICCECRVIERMQKLRVLALEWLSKDLEEK